jgi:hypothetical protein
MKLSMLVVCVACHSFFVHAQNFSGEWKGNITRDFGNEIKTDSIELHLEQKGQKISGYSILHIKPGVFIRSLIKGEWQESNRLLRITETKIDYTNMPDRGEEIFLDRYLLYYELNDTVNLIGKSVASQPKVVYSRSKMELHKVCGL